MPYSHSLKKIKKKRKGFKLEMSKFLYYLQKFLTSSCLSKLIFSVLGLKLLYLH